MTSRALLRDEADVNDNNAAVCDATGEVETARDYRDRAAALRTLADRLDAEMRAVLVMEQETRDTNDASGWGAAAAIAQSLARLDAPLGPAPKAVTPLPPRR